MTERLLVHELRRKGGDVEYDTTFLSAEQRNDCVNITIGCKGGQAKFKASFVVGCDGAHSRVRHLLNLPFAGGHYQDAFMLADVETNETLPANELQLCPSAFGPLAIFPMSALRRRIVATIEHPEGDVPTLEVVRRLLVQRAPPGFEVRNVQWSSYFRIHHRQVALLRIGRIFVAGDAAHIHSPFGGQGMNTGLQDVWNLVWKLDFAARGGGSDDLLDSYTSERRPVIKRVIKTTDLLTKVMGSQSKLVQALRNTIIPLVSRLAPFQRAFVLRLSQLGVAYRGSPIVEGSGERCFDDSMRGGSGIRSRYLLLIGRDSHPSMVSAVQQLCAPLGEIVEPRIARRPGVTLVRPDGYIAYAAPGRDGSRTVASLRAALERARKWSR